MTNPWLSLFAASGKMPDVDDNPYNSLQIPPVLKSPGELSSVTVSQD
jgi:hypothetical protein